MVQYRTENLKICAQRSTKMREHVFVCMGEYLYRKYEERKILAKIYEITLITGLPVCHFLNKSTNMDQFS